ncbi:hypothetical protein Tco_0424995 [Tanacetum coccineum]
MHLLIYKRHAYQYDIIVYAVICGYPKIKQVVEEEQTQPEYLQVLLQSLLEDLQILNEIQPLKQEISNQIQKGSEDRFAELLAEERLQKANQALNESQSPQEMRIQDLEIQKQQCLEEMKEWMNDLSPPIPISPIFCPSSTIPVVDLDLPLEEADVPSFSDDSILWGMESDHDLGEDTTSINALPLDDSMIFPEYESFTFDNDPVDAEVKTKRKIPSHSLPDLFYHLSPIPRFPDFGRFHGSNIVEETK